MKWLAVFLAFIFIGCSINVNTKKDEHEMKMLRREVDAHGSMLAWFDENGDDVCDYAVFLELHPNKFYKIHPMTCEQADEFFKYVQEGEKKDEKVPDEGVYKL